MATKDSTPVAKIRSTPQLHSRKDYAHSRCVIACSNDKWYKENWTNWAGRWSSGSSCDQIWANYWQKDERNKTVTDPTMQILKNYITHGWSARIKSYKNEVKPYFNHKTELVLFHDIVLKGGRIVIPVKLRTNILEKIHAGHQGQEKCKRQARVFVFFFLFFLPCIN